MNYLVFAVFAEGMSVATHSFEHILPGGVNPEDYAEEIITKAGASGLGVTALHEVFVFQSAPDYGDAPKQVAYWDDGEISDIMDGNSVMLKG